MVSGATVNTGRGRISPAPHIAATNDHRNLNTQVVYTLDLTSNTLDGGRINTHAILRAKCLTTQFEQNTLILYLICHFMRSPVRAT
jgi:hypothetical protein